MAYLNVKHFLTAFQLNIKLQDQKFFKTGNIHLLDDGEMIQVTFLLLGLLGEDVVSVKRFLAPELVLSFAIVLNNY